MTDEACAQAARTYGDTVYRVAYHALGNRTLMMDGGSIVLDIQGKEREGLTVGDLLLKFKAGAGKALDNDRILLS